jgi:septum site-determining protein MinD
MVVISIVSAKGGTGKTTVTANLATVLANELRRRVLAIDGNITTPNLAIHLGFLLPPKKTLIELLKGEANVREVICRLPSGVHLIPSSLAMYISYPDPEVLAEKIQELKNEYEYILIDGAAGIGREVISAIKASDTSLIISNPDMTSIIAAIKVIKVVNACEKDVLGIVLNKVRGRKYELDPDKIEELCNVEVIGSVPFDKRVNESLASEKPLVLFDRKSKAAKEFRKLAYKIAGMEVEERESLLEKIIGFLRR